MLDRIVSMPMTSQYSQVKVFLNMVFRFFGDICKYRLCPRDIIDIHCGVENRVFGESGVRKDIILWYGNQ